MSRETSEWLNSNIMVGNGVTPWWLEGDRDSHPNLYSGPLDRGEIRSKLLDWNPNVRKIYDEDMNEIEGYIRLVPSDDPKATLGIHTDGYTVHEYSKMLDASTLDIASAGLLKQRKIFWVTYGRQGDGLVRTPEGVDFLPYITHSSSLDGSLSTTISEHVTLPICDNTLNIAIMEGERIKIKHTKKSGASWLSDSGKAIAALAKLEDDMTREISTLCATDVTEAQWSQFVDEWCPLPEKAVTKGGGPGASWTRASNRRDFIDALYHSDKRVSAWSGTAFGVLQAVNTYANHHVMVQDKSGDEMGETATRVQRNMLRTVAGKWGEIDKSTLETLDKILVSA